MYCPCSRASCWTKPSCLTKPSCPRLKKSFCLYGLCVPRQTEGHKQPCVYGGALWGFPQTHGDSWHSAQEIFNVKITCAWMISAFRKILSEVSIQSYTSSISRAQPVNKLLFSGCFKMADRERSGSKTEREYSQEVDAAVQEMDNYIRSYVDERVQNDRFVCLSLLWVSSTGDGEDIRIFEKFDIKLPGLLFKKGVISAFSEKKTSWWKH